MKKINLLIIGSNFGISHYNAAKISNNFKLISIASPNINQKEISKKIIVFSDYIDALKKYNFDMISIVTKPKIQQEIVSFLLKNNKIPKYLILEKPILSKTINLLKKFHKNKLVLTNFIFTMDKTWKRFYEISKFNESLKSINYEWLFEQSYFQNLKKTWKIVDKEGGGLVNYYLSHVIFNLLYFNKNLLFKKILQKKYFKNKLVYLKLFFLIKKKNCIVKISNNSKTNIHSFKLNYSLRNIELKNISKKWLKGFKINGKKIRNNKKNIKFNDPTGRVNILSNVYKNIDNYFNAKFIEKNKRLTYKTFDIIKKINNQL